ncbi:MAG TPA: hypothetical protein VJN22_05750 [Candidatus Eremiobacteraceae bacterium]|nr:hypothetical protein [Candidatus Eremiobacteraceae bacterium]
MQDTPGIPHAHPFPVWIGFLLCGILFITEVVDVANKVESIQWYVYVATVVTLIYFFMCVFRFHVILGQLTFGAYPIKSGPSVFYHFLPFFNIYWLFAWPSKFADYVKAERAVKVAPGAVLGTILILSALVARFVDSSIGLAGYFGVMAYLTNRLRRYADYRDLDVAADQIAAQT